MATKAFVGCEAVSPRDFVFVAVSGNAEDDFFWTDYFSGFGDYFCDPFGVGDRSVDLTVAFGDIEFRVDDALVVGHDSYFITEFIQSFVVVGVLGVVGGVGAIEAGGNRHSRFDRAN